MAKKVPDFYWPPCWRTKEVLQHGGSILGSVILCGTFRRISQLWDNAHTFKLGELSSLFIVYNITIFWLYPLHSFLFFFFIAWQRTHSIIYVHTAGSSVSLNFWPNKMILTTAQGIHHTDTRNVKRVTNSFLTLKCFILQISQGSMGLFESYTALTPQVVP